MSLIHTLRHLFSFSLTTPVRLDGLHPPLPEKQIAEKTMYAVLTIVESFRTVLQPSLKKHRFKELPGSAFDAVQLQDRMQTQSGWAHTVVLPGCEQGRIVAMEEQPGTLAALLGDDLPELLDCCWIHFLAAYRTYEQETPLLSTGVPLLAPGRRGTIEAGLCVPLRIIHGETLEETRIVIGFSNNLLAFLLRLGLPARSLVSPGFRPEKATLRDGAQWVERGFRNEEAKYAIWPKQVLTQTMLLALRYDASREEA